MYSLNLEFSCNGQKIQIRILIIETLSTQLFGDVEFSFPFCFTKTINFILVKVFLSFCLCRISLFSLFFFIFFLNILYIYIYFRLWNLNSSFEIGNIYFWKSLKISLSFLFSLSWTLNHLFCIFFFLFYLLKKFFVNETNSTNFRKDFEKF